MTTTPERRTATLTELVAQEIDSIRGRKRMSQAQLARAIGKPPMWVSLRLRGMQPIDMNELLMFANALGVGVHDLLPPPEVAAGARGPQATAHYFQGPERTSDQAPMPPARPRDTRPPRQLAPTGPGRSAHLPRSGREKRNG
jgi:transcriptional regulator with XRE-family HTH domain